MTARTQMTCVAWIVSISSLLMAWAVALTKWVDGSYAILGWLLAFMGWLVVADLLGRNKP